VLARPWSAALLLSLTWGIWFSRPLPPTLKDLFALVFLAPLLRVLPGLLPGLFRRPLYGLAALFALDRLASIAPPGTLLARMALLLVTVGALALFLVGLRRRGWVRSLPAGGWGLATRGATLSALGILVVSAVSNVAGNATLAHRLTSATLASATLAVVLLGVQSVLEGALAALLHLPALQRRPLVARHRDLLRHRATTLLKIASLGLWAWRTAEVFGIAAAVGAAGEAVLGLRLQLGGLDVSLGNVAAFAVTAFIALALSRAVRFVLDEGVFAELELPRGIPAAISTTVQYLILLLGFSWAVLASGMEMSRFSFLVGALGVGIGFGLQNVVNNFVSGLILLYERPVQVGDIVEVGAVSGEVTRIGVRSSTVRTFPGAEVIVPNATLISTEVTNWTLSDRRRRIELGVGVAYGTSPPQVIDLLLAAVRGRAGVLESPAPVALLVRFGESAVEFTLRFWTADFDRWQALASEVMIEVHASLGRAGIEIPFPQRDLHLRSLDPATAKVLAAARAPGPR
jgi:potassium-dependent mechanosensitive channel